MNIAVVLKNEETYKIVMSQSSKEEIDIWTKKKEPTNAFPILGWAKVELISEKEAKKLVEPNISEERLEKRLNFLYNQKIKDKELITETKAVKYFCYETNLFIHNTAIDSFKTALRLIGNPIYIIIQKIDYDTDVDDMQLHSQSEGKGCEES